MNNQYDTLLENALNDAQEARRSLSNWKELKKGKHLTVSNIHYKNHALKLNKIEGTIPTSFQKVLTYYFTNLDAQRNSRSDLLSALKVIENVDDNTYVAFSKTKSRFLVSSRETLLLVRKIELSANESVIVGSSLESHPNIASCKDSVQTHTILFAIFVIKIDEDNTQFLALQLTDPRGSIPTSLINTMSDVQLKGYEKDIEALLKHP